MTTTWDVYDRLDVSLDPNGSDSLHELAGEYLQSGDVDPVEIHIERASVAVAAAGLSDRVTLHMGVIHRLPYDDGYFDFVWCRDVLEQVDDLDGRDAEMMRRHIGNVDRNLDPGYVEDSFGRVHLEIERKDVIGTEWREHAEERTQPASWALLRLSRLRRRHDAIVAQHGQDIYDHIEANLHWEVFQLLGKLESVVYVLTCE